MQTDAWEKEYKDPTFLTKNDKPQNDILRFVRFLKKQKIQILDKSVLDLGCGTGRNTNYFSELGAICTGLDISKTALDLAKERALKNNLNSKYLLQSMADGLSFKDQSFDIVLDVTSSNSLSEKEREAHIKEVYRVLKKEGVFFFKGLCLDGDLNAKKLLKISPADEKNTYFLKGTMIKERVWTRKDLEDFYGKYFDFIYLDKKISYTTILGKKYKRVFWIAYFSKK